MPIGTIRRWRERGFGSISDDSQPQKPWLFVHVSEIGFEPNLGDAFSYDVGIDERTGHPRAVNVVPLSAAQEEADRVFGVE